MEVQNVTSLAEVKTANPDLVLFTGAKNPETGVSWCPDCVSADPVIEKYIENEKYKGVKLVKCHIGRPEWKSAENVFKNDPSLKLTSVPTLLIWEDNKKRLVEGQLLKEDMIDMLLEDL